LLDPVCAPARDVAADLRAGVFFARAVVLAEDLVAIVLAL
jgi:hypothetical protein